MIKKNNRNNNLQNENYNIRKKTKTKVFEKRRNKMRKHKLT